jgi:hypothetical protein
MNRIQRRAAKAQLIARMQCGLSWEEAAAQACARKGCGPETRSSLGRRDGLSLRRSSEQSRSTTRRTFYHLVTRGDGLRNARALCWSLVDQSLSRDVRNRAV